MKDKTIPPDGAGKGKTETSGPEKKPSVRSRLSMVESFIYTFAIREPAAEVLDALARQLAFDHADLDYEEIPQAAATAPDIASAGEAVAFAEWAEKTGELNLSSFDALDEIIETLKENFPVKPVLRQMLHTIGADELFIINTAIQARLISAVESIPPAFRETADVGAAGAALRRGFADMVVRAIGGSDPTMDRLFSKMSDTDAADALGQLVIHGADISRARKELSDAANRHALRQAYILKQAEENKSMPFDRIRWVEWFLSELRNTWTKFENRSKRELYEPFDLAREITRQTRESRRTKTNVIDFAAAAAATNKTISR